MLIANLVMLARPEHWIKNAIVLLPVVFAKRVFDTTAWIQAGLAAVAFCFASSAVYAINDIMDRQRDRQHPLKRNRPVASGRVSVGLATCQAAILAAVALAVAFGTNRLVLFTILAYIILQTGYSFHLKQEIIVDVICIALGFVLRAGAGALAIRVDVSPWLVVCTFTICLFMGFCKRRNEIGTIDDIETAANHRRTLRDYTPELLTHLITLSAGIAIVSYLVYSSSPRTVEYFGTAYLVYTLPLVVYGICRFAMQSMSAAYKDPVDIILKDRPFQITLALWFVCAVVIIFWGRSLESALLGFH
jgi:4-hydroxybenzoate polyprenyltransferase